MRTISRSFYVFACCVLGIPTCVYALKFLQADEPIKAVLAGAVLGVAHVVIRPILRLITAPIGCLTLGAFGILIDVGLIYGCAYVVKGFYVPSFVYALLSAFIVNITCLIVSGRR